MVLALAAAMSVAQAAQAGAATMTLTGTIYDKRMADPDFEDGISGVQTGLVSSTLNASGLPDYVGSGGNTVDGGHILSAASFDAWWGDTHGAMPFTLTLNEVVPGLFLYSNDAFFPIDDALGGNEGLPHNYHFTLHLEGVMSFTATDAFHFLGDDDLWVYIDGRLVMDLGGVHGTAGVTVTGADLLSLGLLEGNAYALDIFFAERHTTSSSFGIATSFQVTPAVPEPGILGLMGLGLIGRLACRRARRI
jgi:fibro-slime domain-containing protein